MNAKRGHARKDVSVHEMESAAAIWRFLVESGNVQPEYYDQDIVVQLCDRLKIRGDASAFLAGKADLGQALEDQLVSREDFIHALFSAAQPFAEMMAQLCSFFERHAIRGTDQALRNVTHHRDASSEQWSLTLPAGDYRFRAEFSGDRRPAEDSMRTPPK